uniref:Methyltransf_21 domain-containing protein n=1 Tax=Steinernema glaseri TaxID=37863 RepID=A0A1I7YG30_9BILA
MKTVVLLIFLVTVGFIAFINVSLLCSTHGQYQKIKELPTSSDKNPVLELFRQCLLPHFYGEADKNIFDGFPKKIEYCAKILHFNESSLLAYKNNDEVKYHINPNGDDHSDCHIISIGVGHDVTIEKALNKLHGKCRFYAADPIESTNKDLFTPIGQFFPFAVGASSKVQEANVKLDPNSDTYTHVNFTHVEMVSFLKEKANIPAGKIDQLFLDGEGAEYELIPYFAIGGPLDIAGYDVCQINAEFHLPDNDKKQIFAKFIRKTLSDGRYLPLKTFKWFHMRIYFLNIASQKCVRLYVKDKF